MFDVTVGTRNRITIPYDCWTDVSGGMRTLTMKLPDGSIKKWDYGIGMTKNMAFRVAVPFKENTNLKLIPTKKYIKVIEM